jgi:predicted dehydrogenase
MRIKYYKGSSTPSWLKMMDDDHIQFDHADPLEEQFKHFIRVIRNNEEPKVTAYDGLQNLKVVEAIFAASKFGTTIKI